MWRGKAEDWSSSSRRPFSSARSRIISATSRTMAPRSNGADLSCSRPASILAISSTSLMRVSRYSPLRLMISSRSCWLGDTSGSRRMRLEKPRMAFKGVRSSWLILARNTLLALLAASAASRAMSSSDVRCWTVSSSWSLWRRKASSAYRSLLSAFRRVNAHATEVANNISRTDMATIWIVRAICSRVRKTTSFGAQRSMTCL